eukprot:gene7452-15239_t
MVLYPAYNHKYDYIVVIGAFGAFIFGYGTGSNDVANAFGTSVGSGALSNRHAMMIAAVCEFAGAMLLGRISVSTIAAGIADRSFFTKTPWVFCYGMMWTLIAGGFWQIFASTIGVNVSATHSIIGGIIGFALSYNRNAVLWLVDDPASIPPYKGIVPIVCAWFFAPIATGFCSSTLFMFVRYVVLRSPNAYERAFMVLPFLITFTTWICLYFVLTKGAKKQFQQDSADWTDDTSAWVSAVCAFGAGILSLLTLPWIKKRAEVEHARCVEKAQIMTMRNKEKEQEGTKDIEDTTSTVASQKIDHYDSTGGRVDAKKGSEITYGTDLFFREIKTVASMKEFKDLLVRVNDESLQGQDDFMHDQGQETAEIHNKAEKFDDRAENVMKQLQIFTACCVMFAHGAGEVGYMAGPLSTIWAVYTTGTLPSSASAEPWILVLSAGGLVIGLATYGQRVTRTMGRELCLITASRGFCAEIATATVIMVAAQYGLPTSSSQCITGGIVGIGLVEGVGGVNWKTFALQFVNWVNTLFVMGLGVACLFQQGVNAPHNEPLHYCSSRGTLWNVPYVALRPTRATTSPTKIIDSSSAQNCHLPLFKTSTGPVNANQQTISKLFPPTHEGQQGPSDGFNFRSSVSFLEIRRTWACFVLGVDSLAM